MGAPSFVNMLKNLLAKEALLRRAGEEARDEP